MASPALRASILMIGLGVAINAVAQPASSDSGAAKATEKKAKPRVRQSLTNEQAVGRYRDGLAKERKGDHPGAMGAYHDAAEAGNGPAQVRLAEIYDKGNSA